MIRAISITAYRQFRNGAKQNVNIDYEILKLRLNSIIDSVDQTNISFYSGGKKYRFGNCVFKVDTNNYIRGIYWPTDDLKPTRNEIVQLESNYRKRGLNKRGTQFLNGRLHNEMLA
jgi:hypothetical protein